jgi:hypothetical protein
MFVYATHVNVVTTDFCLNSFKIVPFKLEWLNMIKGTVLLLGCQYGINVHLTSSSVCDIITI